jgi:hypothetical protein
MRFHTLKAWHNKQFGTRSRRKENCICEVLQYELHLARLEFSHLIKLKENHELCATQENEEKLQIIYPNDSVLLKTIVTNLVNI